MGSRSRTTELIKSLSIVVPTLTLVSLFPISARANLDSATWDAKSFIPIFSNQAKMKQKIKELVIKWTGKVPATIPDAMVKVFREETCAHAQAFGIQGPENMNEWCRENDQGVKSSKLELCMKFGNVDAYPSKETRKWCMVNTGSKQREPSNTHGISDEIRELCMKAADFEGCVRAHKEHSRKPEKKTNEVKLDFLGRPEIPGWTKVENVADNEIVYLDKAKALKVRGTYGRYITFQYVHRKYHEYDPGTPNRTTKLGKDEVNCYSAHGTVECTSYPALRITTRGTASTPAGVRQTNFSGTIDCLERTVEWSDSLGGWKTVEGNMSEVFANTGCKYMAILEKTENQRLSGGSPNSGDLRAREMFLKSPQ